MFVRAVVTLMVVSTVAAGAPAFAGDEAAAAVPSVATGSEMASAASRYVRDAFERSVLMEARRLAQTEQTTAAPAEAGHWCAGGLALLAGGAAAAAVAVARRDSNPQKPSPPVGFVLGTGAAAVGGVQAIRSCRR